MRKWLMPNSLSIEECRKLLGSAAENMTDAQIESERDQMVALAHIVFDQFTEEMKRDPERMRWMVHAHETGEIE
jgi:hypothetical protein